MIINELYQPTSHRHTFRYNQAPIMERLSQNWRLLRHPPAGGAWNMAVDEALLESVAGGNSLPVLRLYAWEPACLSLGQAQPAADVDRKRLTEHGWELVRRPTGGRAILHTDELTYAVIAPVDEPHVRGTLLESYLAISRALVKALELLGLEVAARDDPQTSQAARSRNPVCFEEPSSYEILFAGKKIIGSAQARRGNTFLQHGALPLAGDLTRITHALVFPDEAARRYAAATLLARATTVEAALHKQPSWEQAAAAFVTGFNQALGLVFQKIDLSTDETRRAKTIMLEKYAGAAWTLRI